ncbi:MAG TPA: hypothetical protein EYQ83_16430 [Acidobacteria bacterium]|nr:hypothetical protein [Acidobacteriota bacterium]
MLNDRVGDYDAVLTISEYSARTIARRWDAEHTVIAPPAVSADRFTVGSAESLILSVGRFFDVPDGNTKQHLLMVDAFKTLCDRGITGWRLVLAGSSDAAHADYLARVRSGAAFRPQTCLADITCSSRSRTPWRPSPRTSSRT